MAFTLSDRLLRREIGDPRRLCQIKGLYGDSQFVDGLDIVNELSGHSGCVNALSWAKSGRLLASGSDDRVVNIYSYLPQNSSSQFALSTTIDTGHSHNIFSVKFMPHSNDTKIITCAGDHEIRIFDIERSTSPSGSHQYMSMNAARGKVFRSHSSSVKRIVTEASPFYFLTCSEDGEVRQWDIRQRADFYPRQRASFSRLGSATARRSEAPPPLISYADYGIELYTISCSPSQPHYIALGGTHVHCFLHDRRMMGRDRLQERGGRIPVSLGSDAAQQKLEDATRCVAKFAPYGQPKMNRNDTKHITACKLGQANPNELIVSWTGDHIYSFNILKSQTDARLNTFKRDPPSKTNLSNSTTGRKRKRIVTLESPSTGPNSRPRTSSSDEEGNSRQEVSILMQLGNGESIEVPLASSHMPLPLRRARERGDDDSDEESGAAYGQRVRTLKNCLGRTNFAHGEDDRKDEMEAIVRAAARAFEKIDDHIASRTFPITQSASIIDYEMKLRSDRAKVWRFAQASGTLARVLLGPMSDRNMDQELILHYFDIIRPAPREGNQTLDRHEQFGYDFCKVVLLWLESGVGAVLREFSPESQYYTAGTRSRFPVSKDAEIDALETQFIPYLSNLATDMAVVYAGHGGAGDDPRERIEIFGSEKAAVQALAGAMKHPFSDLQGDDEEEPIESSEEAPPIVPIIVNRKAALRFWGHKVCMAVLSNAAIDVNFPFVATAFGNAHSSKRKSTHRRPRQVPTGPIESRAPEEQRLLDEESRNSSYVIAESEQWTLLSQESYGDGERILNNESDADDDDDDDDDDEDNDDNDADEAEDDIQELERAVERALESDEDSDSSSDESYAAGSRRSKFSAGKNVPCSSHLRSYQGHCNVETTKDVNFYGLQDEYVVSGSDCGNFFIWEKKSGRLVNILEGDREVVNVIQPHPYEPMLAVSGIDSTVKIFSPDHRARQAAAGANGITAADTSTFTSIWRQPRRPRPSVTTISSSQQLTPQEQLEKEVNDEMILDTSGDVSDAEEPRVADKGLESRKRLNLQYQITSENDMERRSGMHSSYVSRSMLQLLMTSQIRAHLANGEEGDGECIVM